MGMMVQLQQVYSLVCSAWAGGGHSLSPDTVAALDPATPPPAPRTPRLASARQGAELARLQGLLLLSDEALMSQGVVSAVGTPPPPPSAVTSASSQLTRPPAASTAAVAGSGGSVVGSSQAAAVGAAAAAGVGGEPLTRLSVAADTLLSSASGATSNATASASALMEAVRKQSVVPVGNTATGQATDSRAQLACTLSQVGGYQSVYCIIQFV